MNTNRDKQSIQVGPGDKADGQIASKGDGVALATHGEKASLPLLGLILNVVLTYLGSAACLTLPHRL
jgi:hypothetical protein